MKHLKYFMKNKKELFAKEKVVFIKKLKLENK